MPIVVAVRKQGSTNGTHTHISSVKTQSGGTFTRAEVVAGINAGQTWRTEGSDGSSATIRKLTGCPYPGCNVTPYITTAPDHTTKNNLDNLPTY